MDNSYSTISSHVKGSHLSYEDRILIQIRLKSRCSIREIAREIGCSPSTVSNEIARGSVALYHGRVTCYKASVGQQTYENHRKNSCRHYEYLSKSALEPQMKSSRKNLIEFTKLLPSGRCPTWYCNLDIFFKCTITNHFFNLVSTIWAITTRPFIKISLCKKNGKIFVL